MRLVTRGDVDGLMCAVLLKAAGVVDDMIQVHPKDMQDGLVDVKSDDIVCNLPYAEGCAMWFDHHSSEEVADRLPARFEGRYGPALSAAHHVYAHFVERYPELVRFEGLLEVVGRFDSADLTREDVTKPKPAMLLAFLLDPRTGLGLYQSFQISNREMLQRVPDLLLEHPVEEILDMPDFKERVEHYHALNEEAERVLKEYTRIEGNVLVTDLRRSSWVPPANRFLVYTLPGTEQTDISIRMTLAKSGERVSIQVGHNIFNRTSTVDVGALMAEYGGGGHLGAGTCQVLVEEADRTFEELLTRISRQG